MNLNDLAASMRRQRCNHRGRPVRECSRCHDVRPVRTDGICFACWIRMGPAGRAAQKRAWTVGDRGRVRALWQRMEPLDVRTRICHVVVLHKCRWQEACRLLVGMELLTAGWIQGERSEAPD